MIGYRRIKQEGGQLSLPIVRFESEDSRTTEFTNSWGSFFHELEVESIVAVEYPAGLPHKARIVGSYSPLLAYGLIAVVLAILAVFIAFRTDELARRRFGRLKLKYRKQPHAKEESTSLAALLLHRSPGHDASATSRFLLRRQIVAILEQSREARAATED